MSRNSLSPLQVRILRVLGSPSTPWVLTGGAALALRMGHRTTRDLDLFFRDRDEITSAAAEQERRLRADRLEVDTLQTAVAFKRLRVSDGSEVTILDLVAAAAPPLAEPEVVDLEGTAVRIDALHELLVSKLCALLGRQEPRDLFDTASILQAGGDLERAVADAPRKDAGFSPLLLAWNISSLDLARWSDSAGLGSEEQSRLETFRETLIATLTR